MFVFNVLARRWRSQKWQILYLQNMQKSKNKIHANLKDLFKSSKNDRIHFNQSEFFGCFTQMTVWGVICAMKNNKNVIIHHVSLFTTRAICLLQVFLFLKKTFFRHEPFWLRREKKYQWRWFTGLINIFMISSVFYELRSSNQILGRWYITQRRISDSCFYSPSPHVPEGWKH